MSVLDAAHAARAAGLCVLPVAADGSKRPAVSTWKQFQSAPPTDTEFASFNFAQCAGLGVVSGPVSGYRESWDFDCLDAYDQFVHAAAACGLEDVVRRISTGFENSTPGGGRRWIVGYPREVVWQDVTLARRVGRDSEPAVKTLIEMPTFAIVTPSHGPTHPSGRPYVQLSGGFGEIATYSAAERTALVALARTCDQMPRPAATVRPSTTSALGTRPGDDYARRTSWGEILQPEGWTAVYDRAEVSYWRRPGKVHGVSASTNVGGSDLLYVFSSSTPFASDQSFTKFGAFALLHHENDFAAAARDLARQGYGAQGTAPVISASSECRITAVLDAAEEVHEPPEDRGKTSAATQLVHLACATGAEFFRDDDEGYVRVPVKDHHETYALRGKPSRAWLLGLFLDHAHKCPAGQAITDALNTLEALALRGAAHTVHVRMAVSSGLIYLDLADPSWQVVEVSATGWRVIVDPPVRFRRPKALAPIPHPTRGGSIMTLRPFVNVASDDDFILIVALLVTWLRGEGPYPLLVEHGEQGSGKSTLTRVLKALVDPNRAPLRSVPKEPRDLMIAATNAHLLPFDNLSALPDWLSDSLCRLSTGGGFSTRRLYADREEEIFDAIRPVILNGIPEFASRQDLVGRSVFVTLPPIPDGRRRDEAAFWKAFERLRPEILGSLLDIVATALRHHASVTLDHLPRMADFARWIVAGESACPWPAGTFMAIYAGNRAQAVEATLDGDPVADLVRGFASWSGTATELLAELNRGDLAAHQRPKDWPTKPRQIGDAVRRLAPALRQVGVDVQFVKGRKHGRLITIVGPRTPVTPPASPPSPASPIVPAPPYRPPLGDAVTATGDAGDAVSPHARVGVQAATTGCGIADDTAWMEWVDPFRL